MKTTPKSKRTENPQRDTPLAEQLAAAQALGAVAMNHEHTRATALQQPCNRSPIQ